MLITAMPMHNILGAQSIALLKPTCGSKRSTNVTIVTGDNDWLYIESLTRQMVQRKSVVVVHGSSMHCG